MDQVSSEQNNSQARQRFKPSKRQLFAALCIVLLLTAAGGLGFLAQWIIHRSPDQEKKTVSGLPTVVDDIQNLRLEGDKSEADKKIDEALNDPNTSNSVKQQLYAQKGHAAADAGDYKAAADAYSKAIALQADPDLYTLLGEAYFRLGKKEDARAAYVKGLELLKSNGALDNGLADELQQRIDIIDGKIKPE